MASKFLSPGIFTTEQDFTTFASTAGLTRLGLVGITQKGPAFQVIKITGADQFAAIFGSTDPTLPLPYVANSFLSQANEMYVTRILGENGFTNSPAWLIVAGTGSTNSGATLAIIRSKRNQITNEFYLQNPTDLQIGVVSAPLNTFVLSASTGPLTSLTAGFTVSLDETSKDYIVKKLGTDPSIIDGELDLYVERIYPHFLRESVSRGNIVDLSHTLVYTNEAAYTQYGVSYTNAITPWVVSRVIGNSTKNLFRFQTIADGDTSNTEIKISIENIDIVNNRFDVMVRNFNDTDATAIPTALERFANLSLDETDTNFIARAIGTTNEDYPSLSSYITVDMSSSYPVDTVPAGFGGYTLRQTGISGTTAPQPFYKTTYLSGDTIFKTYLGLSELAYTSLTPNLVSFKNAVSSLEADLFEFQGAIVSSMTTTKGFHMENTADPTLYASGDKNSLTAYTNAAGTLLDKTQMKFTLVPAGGFDGWDKYQTYENPYEQFEDAFTNNTDMFKKAIDTFNNRDEININLFATPGVDYSNNLTMVRYALDMIETRGDSFYIIDSPRLTVDDEKGTPEELVSIMQSTGINSNYAGTYWPWIQMLDINNNIYTYQPPTVCAVKAIALTDSVSNPWFAPAGITRGSVDNTIIKADIKLTSSQRDTLYQGMVNPIATFVQEGVVIWGQKTLQVASSALDRINVRRLLLQVESLIAAASITLIFEQNDQTLRDQFLSRVEPILLNIQNQRGLNAFKVVMDDSNNNPAIVDRNTLNGSILLQPTASMEFLNLTFTVLPTGANFANFA